MPPTSSSPSCESAKVGRVRVPFGVRSPPDGGLRFANPPYDQLHSGRGEAPVNLALSLSVIPAAVILDPVLRLTRASIKKDCFVKAMDCRVKPGNDEGESLSTIVGINPCI